MIQESPAQREAKAARDAFFGESPMLGPSLPGGSKIKESPAQEARRKFKEKFFEPKSMRRSANAKANEKYDVKPPDETKFGPVTGGKTKNEARTSGTGTLILQDCEGTEILRVTNLSGFDDEQTVKVGCEGSSSYPV